MACRKCQSKNRLTASARPVWADAALCLQFSAIKFRDFSLPLGGTMQLARPDPTRWAIGFSLSSGGSGSLKVCPGGRSQFVGFTTEANTHQVWFTQFVYGPLVNLDWAGYSSAGGDCRVWEVYNLPR